MLRFCGFDFELVVEEVVGRVDGPALHWGRDDAGQYWLIVQVRDDPDHLAWLCAAISERALGAVLDGRAWPLDAVRHSATGTVELVTVDHGQAVADRCLLGAQVEAYLQAPHNDRLSLAA
jgi:hypothetical protein